MTPEAPTSESKLQMRPVYGLTQGLPKADLERLTVDAIRTHRRLVDTADRLYQALPDSCRSGKEAGGTQHLTYIQSCIDMHAQMYVVNTLVTILGHIPKVAAN